MKIFKKEIRVIKNLILFLLIYFVGYSLLYAEDKIKPFVDYSKEDTLANISNHTDKLEIPAYSFGQINLGGIIPITNLFGNYKQKNSNENTIKENMGGVLVLYIELNSIYFFGIGFREMRIQTYPAYLSMETVYKEREQMVHDFYTIQWIPKRYYANINIEFLFGYSPNSRYYRTNLTQKGQDKKEKDLTLESEDFDVKKAVGEALIYELNSEYIIGAHGFRLSLFYLVTEFEKFDNGIKPDGDGYGYYLSYRYGFSL